MDKEKLLASLRDDENAHSVSGDYESSAVANYIERLIKEIESGVFDADKSVGT
ncbi:hypothetical protein WMW72_10780 [Paenibacillus filicis]|uniref:Uncharacterized protein n=1 Tax=Paenibacillus filicis TaxID=669464 RepID=A0ABU9DJZ3_9BACL